MASSSELPRLVLVVERITRERLAYDDVTGILDKHGVEVVPLPLPAGAPEWQRALDKRGQLIESVALVANPMRPGDYVAIEEADAQLAQSKAIVFSELCQLLGATSVEAIMVQKEEQSTRLTVKADVNVQGRGAATAKFDDEELRRIAASLNLKDGFKGGPCDVEAARQLLRDTGLDGDQILQSLIQSRANSANPHQERVMKIDLSSEAVRTISAAASVNVPALVKLNVDLKSVKKTANRFTVEYRVTFK